MMILIYFKAFTTTNMSLTSFCTRQLRQAGSESRRGRWCGRSGGPSPRSCPQDWIIVVFLLGELAAKEPAVLVEPLHLDRVFSPEERNNGLVVLVF